MSRRLGLPDLDELEEYEVVDYIPFKLMVCMDVMDYGSLKEEEERLEEIMDAIVRRLGAHSPYLPRVVKDVFRMRNFPPRIAHTLHALGYDFYCDASNEGRPQVTPEEVEAFFRRVGLPVPEWTRHFHASHLG